VYRCYVWLLRGGTRPANRLASNPGRTDEGGKGPELGLHLGFQGEAVEAEDDGICREETAIEKLGRELFSSHLPPSPADGAAGAQPGPGHFDGERSDMDNAGLADPLLTGLIATVMRSGRRTPRPPAGDCEIASRRKAPWRARLLALGAEPFAKLLIPFS
jgi:hypothetical protein